MDATLEYPREYLEFARLFNEGDYFEAHEVLEDLWVVEVPPLKDYYKGLIQMAVAVCHWERGNRSGARKLWISALRHLEPYPPTFEGLFLDAVKAQVGEFFAPLLITPDLEAPFPGRQQLPIIEIRDETGPRHT